METQTGLENVQNLPTPSSSSLRPRNMMQKLETKLKTEFKGELLMTVRTQKEENPDLKTKRVIGQARGPELPQRQKRSLILVALLTSANRVGWNPSNQVFSTAGSVCTYVWTFPPPAASLHVDLPNPVVIRYAVFCCTSVSVDLLRVSLFHRAQIPSSNN